MQRSTIPLVPPAIAGTEPLAESDQSLARLEAALDELLPGGEPLPELRRRS